MREKMYRKRKQFMGTLLTAFFVSALCLTQAYAEDGFEFYEYDFQTGAESESQINIPQGAEEELLLEGYAGKALAGEELEPATESAKSKAFGASSPKAARSKWVKKNGSWYYYGKDGKLFKDGIYKIGGSYYQFDKKGRRTSKKAVDGNGFTMVFSAKTGKMVSRSIPLKVTEVTGSDKRGYSLVLRSYKAKGQARKNTYLISIGKKRVNTALTDRAGKKVKASKIKKNAVIQVYTSSLDLMETSPMGIPGITKMKVLEK